MLQIACFRDKIAPTVYLMVLDLDTMHLGLNSDLKRQNMTQKYTKECQIILSDIIFDPTSSGTMMLDQDERSPAGGMSMQLHPPLHCVCVGTAERVPTRLDPGTPAGCGR